MKRPAALRTRLYSRDYREPDYVTVWVVEIPIYGDLVGGRKQVGWEPWRVHLSRADAMADVREMKKPKPKSKRPKLPKGMTMTLIFEEHLGRVRKFVLAPGQRVVKGRGGRAS